ncbi:amidohydrolase family protein [Kibdelosporangium philippinense]|uniref:Amidohydrolase family protein n=1 Tax=Kibdelosporangium philippinense TaxID=211113 RepID=A0ABS8Z282_9PSEU|nr:amidohydrolase family protein [Kibdelosporangium philippinense]MCE7002041.1 amidohydrolase family protein [Kibdelosporangium philippinense]
MLGKIALEEHVTTPANNELWDSSGEAARNGKAYMDEVDRRLLDVDERVELMDRHGIDVTVLSLTSPGIQSITEPETAIATARQTNDYLREEYVDRHPSRLRVFAAVALQDPASAADELERAVTQLGAVGALVNGYTNIGGPDEARYLDAEENFVFWERVAALNVPVYLHPREPLPSQTKIYQGYSSLVGSAWGFGHETSTHAVRLMLSGLFDRLPRLRIILGHLGEGLPFLLPRLQHRLEKQHDGTGLGKAERRVSEYFSENFYVTTSGHFHTKPLLDAVSEIGSDRVMFSVDYPYESMAEAAAWFDSALIAENDRAKIGRHNAERLFGL